MRILIADDEPVNRRFLEATLGKWGYDVVSARDGQEAWELLQQEDSPRLAILDWVMPRMDGVEVCRRVRSSVEPRLVYLVLLTSRDSKEDIVAGLEAGANDYLAKPPDTGELRARVEVGVRVLALQETLAEHARKLEAQQQETRHFQALARERRRFHAAVSAMSDGLLVTDDHWRIETANRAACLLLNIPVEDAQGKALADVLGPFSLSMPLDQMLESDALEQVVEIARTHAQPALFLDARITRLGTSPGPFAGAVLAVRDVTAERQAHHLQANFFEMVSHKLRTPLTILTGYLGMFSQMPQDQWPQIIQICSREVGRLAGIVKKLLQYKTISADQFHAETQQRAEIAAAAAEAAKSVRELYPARTIEMVTEIEPDADFAGAAPEHLQFILETLLDNAMKFVAQEPVRIRVQSRRCRPGFLEVSVTDNGPGIPHEYHDRVFKGFVQIEERLTGQIPGLGIGLHLSREVVRAYGGEIFVQSSSAEGSTLTFTLPTAEEES